jgi:hypothetical protein
MGPRGSLPDAEFNMEKPTAIEERDQSIADAAATCGGDLHTTPTVPQITLLRVKIRARARVVEVQVVEA